MLCQHCNKRPATVHLTKIVNNSKTEKHLCEECARESEDMGIALEPKFSFHHLLTGLLGSEGNVFATGGSSSHGVDIQCKNCNLTYPQFSQIGRLGCSRCYEAFAPKLKGLLKRVHGSSIHNGKLPNRISGTVRIKKQLSELKQNLQKKIADEEFEEAARLRDEIRQLEKKAKE